MAAADELTPARPGERTAGRHWDTGRVEAFSDGVFAIAMTLLVLELKAPPANVPFWQGLMAQWPGFAAFLLSFLFIGIMWINHHRLFQHITRSDDVLMLKLASPL